MTYFKARVDDPNTGGGKTIFFMQETKTKTKTMLSKPNESSDALQSLLFQWKWDVSFCHCVIFGGFASCHGCSSVEMQLDNVANESKPWIFVFKFLLQICVIASQGKNTNLNTFHIFECRTLFQFLHTKSEST